MKAKSAKASKPVDTPAPAPVQVPVSLKPKRRRRRRRQGSALLAERTLREIKAKERQFLAEVSRMLTDALGFPVRVSHVKLHDRQGFTPRMNTFARLSKAKARQQIMDAFAPLGNDPPN